MFELVIQDLRVEFPLTKEMEYKYHESKKLGSKSWLKFNNDPVSPLISHDDSVQYMNDNSSQI